MNDIEILAYTDSRITELEEENAEKEIKISRLKEAVANEHTQFLETKVKLEKQLDFNISLGKKNEQLNRDKTELVNSVTELEGKITELEKQIEKMKDCRNCKHYGNYKDDFMCVLVGQKIHCKNKDKWECK